MDRDGFWALIESARVLGSGVPEDGLREALSALSAAELVGFQRHFDEVIDAAYQWKLWCCRRSKTDPLRRSKTDPPGGSSWRSETSGTCASAHNLIATVQACRYSWPSKGLGACQSCGAKPNPRAAARDERRSRSVGASYRAQQVEQGPSQLRPIRVPRPLLACVEELIADHLVCHYCALAVRSRNLAFAPAF